MICSLPVVLPNRKQGHLGQTTTARCSRLQLPLITSLSVKERQSAKDTMCLSICNVPLGPAGVHPHISHRNTECCKYFQNMSQNLPSHVLYPLKPQHRGEIIPTFIPRNVPYSHRPPLHPPKLSQNASMWLNLITLPLKFAIRHFVKCSQTSNWHSPRQKRRSTAMPNKHSPDHWTLTCLREIRQPAAVGESRNKNVNRSSWGSRTRWRSF